MLSRASADINDLPPKARRLLRAGVVLFILMIIASTVLNILLRTWTSSLFLVPLVVIGLIPFALSARKEEQELRRKKLDHQSDDEVYSSAMR